MVVILPEPDFAVSVISIYDFSPTVLVLETSKQIQSLVFRGIYFKSKCIEYPPKKPIVFKLHRIMKMHNICSIKTLLKSIE